MSIKLYVLSVGEWEIVNYIYIRKKKMYDVCIFN